MPLVKMPVRLSDGSRAKLQDEHARVVVVQHFALTSLPDQLVEGWLGNCRSLLHQFPLRGRRQWNPHTSVRLLRVT
jgi:hypothetical protein